MKIRNSIFTKLFVVIIISAVLILFLIGAFFGSRFSHHRYIVLMKNLDSYADYIIRDLGFPPDENTGKLLSKKTQLNISVESDSVNWATAQFTEWNKKLVPTGAGFYSWKKGKAIKQKAGTGNWNMDEITNRLVLRLLNESVSCVREKVVSEPDLLDAGMIFGTGFAPFRGGPMNHLNAVGRDILLKQLAGLQKLRGERFTPDAGWQDLA